MARAEGSWPIISGEPSEFQLETTYEIKNGNVAVMPIQRNDTINVFRECRKLTISEPIVAYRTNELKTINEYFKSGLSMVGAMVPNKTKVVNEIRTREPEVRLLSFFANKVPFPTK